MSEYIVHLYKLLYFIIYMNSIYYIDMIYNVLFHTELNTTLSTDYHIVWHILIYTVKYHTTF